MSDIQSLLEKIKTSVLGRDVRGAIHDAIEKCYEDGVTGATDLEARKAIQSLNAEVEAIKESIEGHEQSITSHADDISKLKAAVESIDSSLTSILETETF